MGIFKKQLSLAAMIIFAMTLLLTSSVFAHVVVKPGDVLTGAFQTFTMGVPNEKDNAVVAVKLQIPDGLQFVSPTVKSGWNISVEKEGEGETAKVKSITWSGGNIPSGQRDDFTFSAKTPDQATSLQWKAYQTYENGLTVAWDQDPSKSKSDDDSAPIGPYSVSNVASAPTNTDTPDASADDNSTDSIGRFLGGAALVVSFIALALGTRRPISKK